ncbi:MAG TPA: methyltransferase domain-containing protein [Actinomycetota bacterium]|nr:methyltransferase domain-containing protein [Actinomycetota bacterium]
MKVRLTLARWYLGLHGLALLRSYPFGDPKEAESRMEAMRSLLQPRGDDGLFDVREYEVFDTAEAYELWAETYDEPNPLIQAEEAVLIAHLDQLPAGLALDVATGTGRVARHLVERRHRVIACDRSNAMLRCAAERVEGIPLVHAALPDLPFRPSSLDLVTCSLALTHVSDLRKAVTSLGRLLRPGGALVISEIHPFAVLTGAHAFFRRSDDSRAVTRNEQHRFSDYVTVALDAGLTIEACSEAVVDEQLLRDFDIVDDQLEPERALLGLPFSLVLTLRRRIEPALDSGDPRPNPL